MVTSKGDGSKDIMSNDCNYMADLKLQVPTAELVLTAALSRFLLVVHQRNDSPGVERNATVQGGIRENSPPNYRERLNYIIQWGEIWMGGRHIIYSPHNQ